MSDEMNRRLDRDKLSVSDEKMWSPSQTLYARPNFCEFSGVRDADKKTFL